MRFTKMKKVKKECSLDALVELPPAPDGEMLAAFAKAMRVVAVEKTFDEMSVLDIVGASGFTSRTFYNHFRSKYDLLFWSYVSEDYRALQMPGGDCPMRTCLPTGAVRAASSPKRNSTTHSGGCEAV